MRVMFLQLLYKVIMLACFWFSNRSLNDDSPVGLRRILSHSTDSLNFRNRAMSMESLNDEGTTQDIHKTEWKGEGIYKVCCVLTNISTGEMYYASMLEELEKDGKDFEADSWSMAVDSSYLQSQRKDVIKRQDVIYGETSFIFQTFLKTWTFGHIYTVS